MIKPAIALLAAITAFAGLAPTQAAAGELSSTTVQYSDLDLKQPAQVAELDRRLQVAVSDVCGKTAKPGIDTFHDWRRCLNEARNSAADGRAIALGTAPRDQHRVIIERATF